jgi:hypothetical protein
MKNDSKSISNLILISFSSLSIYFERVVQGKMNNELNSKFDSRKKLPKMGMAVILLKQTSLRSWKQFDRIRQNVQSLSNLFCAVDNGLAFSR